VSGQEQENVSFEVFLTSLKAINPLFVLCSLVHLVGCPKYWPIRQGCVARDAVLCLVGWVEVSVLAAQCQPQAWHQPNGKAECHSLTKNENDRDLTNGHISHLGHSRAILSRPTSCQPAGEREREKLVYLVVAFWKSRYFWISLFLTTWYIYSFSCWEHFSVISAGGRWHAKPQG
jgi:hypothetical protein